MIKIKSLHIYPIKSLGGIELGKVEVTKKGLAFDRRWMLVDENNQFISQRTHPKLALLQPSILGDQMQVKDRSGKQSTLTFDLAEPETQQVQVSVWDDSVLATPLPQEVNNWFSSYLNLPLRLVYMPDNSIRQADKRYAVSAQDQVSFADGYPILIISDASMSLLNSKLDAPLHSSRFRANVIVSGSEAHEEDTWQKITIQEQTLFGVKPCARCVMTTVDPKTAELGKEPLKTLSTYRKFGSKILFGENFIPAQTGALRVGDEIKVMEKKKASL